MINKEETKEQIETAKQVSKYVEQYVMDWIKNNPNYSLEEIQKLLNTIQK